MSAFSSEAGALEQVNAWGLGAMTALNRDILQKRRPFGDFAAEFGTDVLAHLPDPEVFSPVQAQQLLVVLGLAGASVGRHYQEAAVAHRASPEQAFAGLTVGAHGPFTRYFARLAERSDTGHSHRDSFASLVRWNVPAAEVERDGTVIAALPSVFSDGRVRTYTGADDELRFFGLLKASEAVEKAVNAELLPLSDGTVALAGSEARTRIAQAVVLLDKLREINQAFALRPPGEGLQTNHFMDVFRQYAVHWTRGDIPPSGALDPEALIRDLLVGIDLPSYPEHVQRMSPALLGTERALLAQLLERESLPARALADARIAPAALAQLSPSALHRLVVRHPVLAALYYLLNAHARVAGVHLGLSKRFLFEPQRVRDQAGLGDSGVVSNRSGTTGMDETRLELLTRVRHQHPLAPLRAVPGLVLRALARPSSHPPLIGVRPLLRVRFTGSDLDPYDLGLPPDPPADRTGQQEPVGPDPAISRHSQPGAA